MADTNQILRLAAIIREVDGNHSKGAAALAESILDHPDFRAALAKADEPAVPECREPTRDELWELWLRLSNELPDRPAAVAEFWEHAQIDARARWGNPAPQPPAEGDVEELVLRVQRLEAMRETEKAALLDAFKQLDDLKHRIDFHYMKIHRLEDALPGQEVEE